MTKDIIDREDYIRHPGIWSQLEDIFKDGDISKILNWLDAVGSYEEYFVNSFFSDHIYDIIMKLVPEIKDCYLYGYETSHISETWCKQTPILIFEINIFYGEFNYETKVKLTIPFKVITEKNIRKIKRLAIKQLINVHEDNNLKIYEDYLSAKEKFDKLPKEFVEKMNEK